MEIGVFCLAWVVDVDVGVEVEVEGWTYELSDQVDAVPLVTSFFMTRKDVQDSTTLGAAAASELELEAAAELEEPESDRQELSPPPTLIFWT